MKIRYLPITCLYSSSTKENYMPLICLSGKWLEKAGFITGDEVSVQVRKHGELVIKLIPEAEEKEVIS
jgi:hypothetical protein